MGKLKKQAKRDAKRDIALSLAKSHWCVEYQIVYTNGTTDYISTSLEEPFCPWLWSEAVHRDVPDAPMILSVERYIFRSKGQPFVHFKGCPPLTQAGFKFQTPLLNFRKGVSTINLSPT